MQLTEPLSDVISTTQRLKNHHTPHYPRCRNDSAKPRTPIATRTSPHTASAGRRRSYATDLLRRGVAVEIVQHLLGHASISTTIDTYNHLGIEDARRALVTAGVLPEPERAGQDA